MIKITSVAEFGANESDIAETKVSNECLTDFTEWTDF